MSCHTNTINNTLTRLEAEGLIKIFNKQSPYRKILLSENAKVKPSTSDKTESYFVKNREVTLLKSQTELKGIKENYIFALKNKKDWPLTQAKYDEYQTTYPDVDLDTELKKMIQWLRDNPTKRKTAAGMPRFINSWLSRIEPKPLWHYIYEKHTEYNAGSCGGYDSEQAEQQLIDEAFDNIHVPPRKDLDSWLTVKPEDLRNSDDDTDVELLKAAVEYTIGSLCLNHLLNAENEKYTASQRYLETLTVCITLTDNWQEMFN
mgnify:CR=1 FL=1